MSKNNQQSLAMMTYVDLVQLWVTRYVDKLTPKQLSQVASGGPNLPRSLQPAALVWQQVRSRSEQRAQPMFQ